VHNRYKVADIENLKNELELLPEADRESRQIGLKDVMKVLGPVLREMRDRRGYTNERLLAILREKGVEIGKSTLNDYLRTKRRPAVSPRPVDDKSAGGPAQGQELASAAPTPSASPSDKGPPPVPAVRAPLATSARSSVPRNPS
jgi:hypothetical protein